MKDNREKVVVKTSIISILANIILAGFKDYKISITLDVDISD